MVDRARRLTMSKQPMSEYQDRVERIRANLASVRRRIEAVSDRADTVRIVAVTKTLPPEVVVAAIEAGVTDIGENYAQEAIAKHLELSDMADHVHWHFIGHLQRNKVRLLKDVVSTWQSIDNLGLIDELAKRAPGATLQIEVNLSGEAGRAGCSWDEVDVLVNHARRAELNVTGLMGIAPIAPEDEIRQCFRRLFETSKTLELSDVSMGMSGDFEIAVQEGATIVRIGSALFGNRPNKTT